MKSGVSLVSVYGLSKAEVPLVVPSTGEGRGCLLPEGFEGGLGGRDHLEELFKLLTGVIRTEGAMGKPPLLRAESVVALPAMGEDRLLVAPTTDAKNVLGSDLRFEHGRPLLGRLFSEFLILILRGDEGRALKTLDSATADLLLHGSTSSAEDLPLYPDAEGERRRKRPLPLRGCTFRSLDGLGRVEKKRKAEVGRVLFPLSRSEEDVYIGGEKGRWWQGAETDGRQKESSPNLSSS